MKNEKPEVRILLVEDNLVNIEFTRGVLEKAGYKVDVARNGHEGINILHRVTPDLMLVDLMMPGMDGFEFCRQKKKLPSTEGVPVIILTSSAEKEDVDKCVLLGIVDYVLKPINVKLLLQRIENHLAQSRRH